jgi:hypothetical protein
LEAQRTDSPGKGSPDVDSMFEMLPLAVGVGAYGCIPKANPIINEVCIVVEIIAVINKEAVFFSDAIVDGSERWQRTATHRDSFGLLHNDVVKLDNIVLEQNVNGVKDGMLTGVQTQCTREWDVCKVATDEYTKTVNRVDIGVHADGVHRKKLDGWR